MMATFARRIVGAAFLDSRTYEDVEADAGATGQAVTLVLLTGAAGGVGLLGFGGTGGAASVVVGAVAAVIAWMAWAMLTYLIGTRLLPEPFKEITSPYWLNERRLRDHKIELIGEKIAEDAGRFSRRT